MTRVGFIGTGEIAAPMARALARNGHSVTVSERNAEVAAGLANAGLGISVAPNAEVVRRSDTVLLCLRPAIWADVVTGLGWRKDQRIVSVMAGVAIADIALVCAPVTDISATVPYGFVEHGGCPLPVAGNPAAVHLLFGADNPVLPQRDEAALLHHFAASTVTTATLTLLVEVSRWLAERTGDDAQAEAYVSNLASGFLRGLDRQTAGHLLAERAALATPNTLNLQMLQGLEQRGALDTLPAILNAILASMTKGR